MKKIVFTFILLLFFAGQASASWIDISFNVDDNQFQDVTVWLDGTKVETTAGEFGVKVYDGQKLNYSSFGYCVELNQGADDGAADLTDLSTYTESKSMEFEDFNQAAWLIDQNRILADTLVEKAGLQLAVWDVIYGNRLDVNEADNTKGIFDAYTDYFGQLNLWPGNAFNSDSFKIAEIVTPPISAEGYPDPGPKQDLMVYSVPVPASLVLMGLGVAGISSVRRKKIFKA